MLNPDDTPEEQVAKQAKIIDALMRRANRQRDVGPSAFRAFQSAIELKRQVLAQSRDLERAATELESARDERERTRKSLVEALSSMEEGFAIFRDGRLDLCNELFRGLLPDITSRVIPGLSLQRFLALVSTSAQFVAADRSVTQVAADLDSDARTVASVVIELRGDRWYQMNAQRSSRDNVVVLLTDISSLVRRNRTEKENLIDRQADYLQAVFQNMTSGVCTFSSDGEVMMLNARFRDILGLPETMLDAGVSLTRLLQFLRLRGLITPAREVEFKQWRRELLRDGSLRRRIGDDAGRVIDIQANRLPDGGFLVELKDVTLEARMTETLENRVAARTAELTRINEKLQRQHEEMAQVEEELRLAKERAEAAVSSKTRFLAAASHDLLQPINAAKLLIATLRETTRGTEHFAMIERLDGAFGSAEQLLSALLDISRLESPDPDAVSPADLSLAPIMEGVHADQALLAETKGIALDIVPCSAMVHSDPVYLLRSIQNLVVNALQYTPAGGRVLVGCRRRGGKIVLEVWDTGIGIARDEQERIFEAFTRAENPTGSGMGLGLSVVDRACRLLGHKLSVRSAPGRGSIFRIEMDEVQGTRRGTDYSGLLRSSEDLLLDHVILVIENDADALYATTRWLERHGASVLSAPSTEAAMTFVRDMGMPPDIILADYQLDGTDTGVEAIARIRAETGTHVPAILITANRSENLRQSGIQNDVEVLTKPVKLSRLRVLIHWKIRWQTGTDAVSVLRELTIPTKVDGDSADALSKLSVQSEEDLE